MREYRSSVSTSNLLTPSPFPLGRSTFQLQVFSDSSSLAYDIYVESARTFGGALTNVSIYLGDPLSEGPLLLELTGRYSAYNLTGFMKDVRRGLMDTLMNDQIEKYILIKTKEAPQGFMRGQLNTDVTFSANTNLSGSNVTPAVTTTTTGNAQIRVVTTTNSLSPVRTMYSKVTLENDEPGDPATTATINSGTVSSNGPSVFNLVAGSTFGQVNKTVLTEKEYQSFFSDPLFINVTSAGYKNGKIRGQLR
jgi:hypothetical protein